MFECLILISFEIELQKFYKMRNFTFLIGFFILLISCSPSKEELLISDYEQTIGNTKTNLNLKFVKVEFVKDVTSNDSLEVLSKHFNEKKEKKIKQLKELMEMDNKIIKGYEQIRSTDPYMKDFYKGRITNLKESVQRRDKSIDTYNGDCKGTFLELMYNKINKLETNLDSVLSKKYNVVYTINNPMLNNVEQTLTKTYYFNSNITEILNVSKDTIR